MHLNRTHVTAEKARRWRAFSAGWGSSSKQTRAERRPLADLKIQLPELLVRVEVLDNPFSIASQSIKILYVILSEANRNAVCEVEVLRSE